jgi:hypothetical protein
MDLNWVLGFLVSGVTYYLLAGTPVGRPLPGGLGPHRDSTPEIT